MAVAHQRGASEEYAHLLSPLELKRIRLPNRIVMTAHRKGMDIPMPGPREIDYLERRARGGVGLIVTEVSSVHPTSLPYEIMPTPYDRDSIPAFRNLAAAIHGHDTKIFGQLYHAGGQSPTGFLSERPIWAPSERRGWGSFEIAHEMTREEIAEVVEGFAQSAVNLAEAGMDGVELHGGNGYLIQQFMSPLTNQRTDEYGGSLGNRVRFAAEVIAAVRAKTGPDFPIGFKVTVDERMAGGIAPEDGFAIAERLDELGELEYLCVTNGHQESYELLVPSSYVPAGEAARIYGAKVKEHVTTPVMAVGGVRWPDLGEELVATGKADLVGMLRAVIADPDLPRRLVDGDLETVRPCIGNNYCFYRAVHRAPLRCSVNPAVGRERAHETEMSTSAPAGISVAVVGAGPAGLEAACTAAERGAKVMLFDEGEGIGGQVEDAAKFPGKAFNAFLVHYYTGRLRRAGVEVNLRTRVDDLRDLTAFIDDVGAIIVATGTHLDPMPWHDRSLEPEGDWNGPELFGGRWSDLLRRDLHGARVVLIEAEPTDHIATAVATYLATKGVDFRVVTSFPTFAGMLDAPTRDRVTRLLTTRAVPVYTSSYVLPSEGNRLRIYQTGPKQEVELDDVALVVSTYRRRTATPLDADGIAAGERPRVLYAGDCVAPRGIAQAVREGYDAAVAL